MNWYAVEMEGLGCTIAYAIRAHTAADAVTQAQTRHARCHIYDVWPILAPADLSEKFPDYVVLNRGNV